MGIVEEIEVMETENDKPLKDVIIANCGEISRDKIDTSLIEDDGTEDKFPHHPSDLDGVDWFLQENFGKILEITTKIKNAGNKFYKEKDYPKAMKKYKKACRYVDSHLFIKHSII